MNPENSLLLTLAHDGLYDLEETTNLDLLLLALFLLEDALEHYEELSTWLASKEDVFSGESLTAVTRHNTIISITGSFDDTSDEQDAYTIEIKQDNLEELLDQWLTAVENEKPHITLQQHDTTFSLLYT